MKKLYITLFLLAAIISVSAEIAVKSFRKLENDMTARIDAPKKDQNGDVCSIIKVVTTQTGFIWEPDGLGIVSAENKSGEYWLYVPFGAKRLTVKHSQLGILRDYMYTLPIEKACVYEMQLTTGKVTVIIEETIESQWLIVSPTPEDAAVYINDEYKENGAYSAKIKPGKYSYRVEAPLYHTDAGVVEVVDAKKTVEVTLKPAFGYLNISTSPEQGAKIVMDGKPLTQTTPAKTEALSSGEHTIQVLKDMYKPTIQKVIVNDGQTTSVNLTMQANFAELSVTVPANATVFLNNSTKGKGNWQGRLGAGIYTVEARMEKHTTAKQDIELTAGDNKTIILSPLPIYGSLDLISKPLDAKITIDGKEYGSTPNTINKLLIGDYTVSLSKTGYATVNRTVTIAEGKNTELNEILSNGRPISINSTPSGTDLYIDNQHVGLTPYSGSLSFGSHTIRIEQGNKKAEKIVEIIQSGGETNFNMSFGLISFTETVKSVSFEMVAVKGGTFLMGSNEGEDDEKPVHSVTVSDFYIGKTEVTQALWVAVMGNNPSNKKGDKFPVENVSWNDCQQFITRLNQLNSKKYRLPTEAEWEYAAGGGASNRTKWAGTNDENSLRNFALFSSNSGRETQQVTNKQPNALGIYDMSGNVWEWCLDLHGSYPITTLNNPTGSSTGSYRVIRGGSWDSYSQRCRSTFRNPSSPSNFSNSIGFRLVLVP